MLKHLGIPLSSQMLVFSKTSGAASLKRVEELVRYMLFADEAKLEGPVKVTSDFAREFARRGPRDRQGRSLRHFDLTRRMFRYPCAISFTRPRSMAWRRRRERSSSAVAGPSRGRAGVRAADGAGSPGSH